ncbi:hypothetical protein [Cylindrospermopsis raciborskii]|uniref:hypothetical protein n=1 Tax=Cylindrospermopsis raciborskii TaxID=77022 RepID=UPI000C9E7DB8|nr:hypothetical protein [Cylindrospermopsis raciborskii]
MHSRREIALRNYPPVPSQGKNLNILKGDREALPLGDALSDYPPVSSQGKILKVLRGDRIALPKGDRS